MSLLTPPPQDRPDWYLAYAYATDINTVPEFTTAGPAFVMNTYIGNAPAFGFMCNITGGKWELGLQQGNEPELPPSFLPNNTYLGDFDCTVHDNIPTAAAWMTATITPMGGGPLTVKFVWWLSQTPEAGSVINLGSGIVIDETAFNCPHGVVTNIPGSLLLPGPHQYAFDPVTNLTGPVNLSGYYGGALHGRIFRVYNPVANVSLQDECIVSNVQPVWQIDNTGVADVEVNVALTRGF